MYTTQFRDGNYLWDWDNKCLIRYNDDSSVIVKGNASSKTNTAFPIAVNEDILDLLGFKSNHNGGYILGCNEIIFDGCAPYGNPYKLKDKPVRYLNDIQNICEDNGITLNIDEVKLYYLLK